MKFRSVIDSPCGLRYMFEALDLQSGAARRVMLERDMMTDREQIAAAYGKLSEFCDAFTCKRDIRRLQNKLSGLKDIYGALARLESGGHLDEVALFEIKELCLTAEETDYLLDKAGISTVRIPPITEPLAILDPDGQKIPSFYIYDCYSPVLKKLRDLLKNNPSDGNEAIIKVIEEERRVCRELSEKLREYAGILQETLSALIEIDILLAKALQKTAMGLVIPRFSDSGETNYEGIFHPQVRDLLAKRGKEFQPVDIYFGGLPTTLIGANMGGKTVALKMVALSQYLFQFGFAVPAGQAEIDVKKNVRLFIGEEESLECGLSSFAVEVVRIDEIIASARAGSRDLALIDEPARTTNPVEGTALVSALISTMRGLNTDLMVTTHYNLADSVSRRFKVRGLVDGRMDYAIEETSDSEVPREALNIARGLNADAVWIDEAEKILERGKR